MPGAEYRGGPRAFVTAGSPPATLPFRSVTVKIRGTNREIGRAVGESARSQVRSAVGWYAEHFRAMARVEYSQALVQAREYLAIARTYLPQYVEELEGLAEGAGVGVEEIAIPNCGEEFTCGAGAAGEAAMKASPGCTAVAVAHGGRHIVGHNMDWYSVDLDKNVLFDVTGPEGVRFLAFCGVPYLPALGMNSAGIAYVGNALYCSDQRPGIPNVLVRRWVLDARTVAHACRRATHVRRASRLQPSVRRPGRRHLQPGDLGHGELVRLLASDVRTHEPLRA